MIIYKYTLDLVERQSIQMPVGSKIISVHEQRGSPCMWVVIPDGNGQVPETRRIRIIGTGHEFDQDDNLIYLGTVHMNPYVWHLFEERS